MVLLDNDRTLAAYDEPDERWDALQEQMVSGELSHASPGGSIASVEWGGGVDAVLPAVLAALNTDGVCVVKNAMSAATAAAIREQMEPHLARLEATNGMAKGMAAQPKAKPDDDDAAAAASAPAGRRAGAVLSRSEAAWEPVQHPLVMALLEGVLGRQVLTKTREEMQSELFYSRMKRKSASDDEPQERKGGVRQHPFQLDFTGVVEVAADGGVAQGLHIDTGKHMYEFRGALDPSISVLWALSPFTPENGATRLAKGSSRWPLDRVPKEEELTPAVMDTGSFIIFRGATYHGAGGNSTPETRAALLFTYSLGWLRQGKQESGVYVPPARASQRAAFTLSD
jgi:ectoine hydroxylase-related dioxygenase (phytanoyl-CoA dioxygenase family)